MFLQVNSENPGAYIVKNGSATWEDEAEEPACVAFVMGLPSFSTNSHNQEHVAPKAPLRSPSLQTVQNQGVLHLQFLKYIYLKT